MLYSAWDFPYFQRSSENHFSVYAEPILRKTNKKHFVWSESISKGIKSMFQMIKSCWKCIWISFYDSLALVLCQLQKRGNPQQSFSLLKENSKVTVSSLKSVYLIIRNVLYKRYDWTCDWRCNHLLERLWAMKLH